MNIFEKILGFGAFFPVLGAMILFLGNSFIAETFGLWILFIPTVAGITTFISLFYVYRNESLNKPDYLWIISLAVLFVFIIPFFWYQKIYKKSSNDA
ncbi:MAG: hypothetical protein ACRBEE_00825 [Arenicella sp.]